MIARFLRAAAGVALVASACALLAACDNGGGASGGSGGSGGAGGGGSGGDGGGAGAGGTVCVPDATEHGELLNAPTDAVTIEKVSRHPEPLP